MRRTEGLQRRMGGQHNLECKPSSLVDQATAQALVKLKGHKHWPLTEFFTVATTEQIYCW